MTSFIHLAVIYLDLIIMAAFFLAIVTAGLLALEAIEWAWCAFIDWRTDEQIRQGMRELQRKGELP